MKKRKLTKKNLAELAKKMPVLSEDLQRSFVGGGDGSQSNPFTIQEYDSMVASGTWQGGYVEGWGYTFEDLNCTASGQIRSEFNSVVPAYYFAEGVSIRGTSYVNGFTYIQNGQMYISVTNASNPYLDGVIANGYIEIIVNGSSVSTGILTNPSSIIYQTGTNPLGSTSFNLSQYQGDVEVKLHVGFSYNNGAGHNGSSFSKTIYSNYR